MFVGKSKLESAVAAACAKFNEGAAYYLKVMESLSIQPLELTRIAAELEDKRRIVKSDSQTSLVSVNYRRARLRNRSRTLAQQEQDEGVTYGPGMNID